jgi:hypothetical protein
MRETITMVAEHVVDHRVDEAWTGTVLGTSVPDDARDRWMELRIYRLDPGQQGNYLAWRVAKSYIYHTGDTSCRTRSGSKPGRLGTVANLPADAEPCDVCNPLFPDELPSNVRVRVEVDKNTINRADTAQELVDALTHYRDRATGQWVTRVSEPVEYVIEQASRRDPAFAQVELPKASSVPAMRRELAG